MRVVLDTMSVKRFESTLLGLLGGGTIPDPADQINPGDGSRTDTARALNAAFLITLAGPGHPLFWEADVLFEKIIRTEEGSQLGRYYQRGRSAIWREIEPLGSEEHRLDEILAALVLAVQNPAAAPSGQSALLPLVPVTTDHLRNALTAAALFAESRNEEAADLLERAAQPQ